MTWPAQRVLTLGSLSRALHGQLEPNHVAWFQNPRPTSPNEPQNLLRPTLQNGPSLIDHSGSSLGRLRTVPNTALGPPARTQGLDDATVGVIGEVVLWTLFLGAGAYAGYRIGGRRPIAGIALGAGAGYGAKRLQETAAAWYRMRTREGVG